MPRIQWDDALVSKAKKVISKSGSLREAATKLGVSRDALVQALARRGVEAGEFLPKATLQERSLETIANDARKREQAKIEKREQKAVERRLAELEDALSFMHQAPSAPPIVKTPSSRPKSGKRIGTPVMLVSDLHFGETVTLAESLGTNEYDLRIAQARMRKCWDNMLWIREDMSRTVSCDHTLLVIDGDTISGDIHEELSETNDGGIREQCDVLFHSLYPGIVEVAAVTPGLLHVVCEGGNHGRLTKKQNIKNGTQHSAEHIGVYDPLRRQIGAGPKGNIVWHIPPSERYLFTLHERILSIQHGTMIRSQGGIGGTLVPMNRWATRDASADLYLFGHFHEADAFGRIIKNGSLIGESGYTKWLGVESRPPEQVMFCLDADAGVRRFERVSVWASGESEKFAKHYRKAA